MNKKGNRKEGNGDGISKPNGGFSRRQAVLRNLAWNKDYDNE
jgi:hypothetical protein